MIAALTRKVRNRFGDILRSNPELKKIAVQEFAEGIPPRPPRRPGPGRPMGDEVRAGVAFRREGRPWSEMPGYLQKSNLDRERFRRAVKAKEKRSRQPV